MANRDLTVDLSGEASEAVADDAMDGRSRVATAGD